MRVRQPGLNSADWLALAHRSTSTAALLARVSYAVWLYPGPSDEVADAAGISRRRLRAWVSGDRLSRQIAAPTVADADKVRAAVRALLLRSLARLDEPTPIEPRPRRVRTKKGSTE
jgi:hypothetical protein